MRLAYLRLSSAVATMEITAQHQQDRNQLPSWVVAAPLVLSLALLYIPTYWDFARSVWTQDEHAHEPLVLAIAFWLAWTARSSIVATPSTVARLVGGVALAFGLISYFLGRTQDILLLEIGSQIPVFLGIVLLIFGGGGLRALWFPLLYLVFMLPLPSFIVDGLTAPLKQQVSVIAEDILHALGYPIARSGVVLSIGPYELLVADACSGLHSLISMSAMGLLYVYLTGHESRVRNAILVAAVLPIGFLANVVRVIVLVLVTYHFGDEAGQGVIHDSAGVLLFIVGILILFLFDAALGTAAKARGRRNRSEIQERAIVAADHSSTRRTRARALQSPFSGSLALTSTVAFFMVCTSALAVWLKPSEPMSFSEEIQLEALIPTKFGDWRIDPSVVPLMPSPDVQAALDKLYSQTLARTYINSLGQRVMLSVAYGTRQTDSLRVHQPEGCYAGQGFQIIESIKAQVSLTAGSLPVTRLVAAKGQRNEPITYWMRIGDSPARTQWEMKKVQLRYGLSGQIPDGILVRVSNISTDKERSFSLHREFIEALLASVGPKGQIDLIGLLE